MARKEFVYFIEDGDEIKIGRSYAPRKRLFQLRMEKTQNMKILATIQLDTLEDAVAKEKELHKRFGWDLLSREWFVKSPSLLAFIEEVNRG